MLPRERRAWSTTHVVQSGYRAMAPEPGRQIPIEGDARSARIQYTLSTRDSVHC